MSNPSSQKSRRKTHCRFCFIDLAVPGASESAAVINASQRQRSEMYVPDFNMSWISPPAVSAGRGCGIRLQVAQALPGLRVSASQPSTSRRIRVYCCLRETPPRAPRESSTPEAHDSRLPCRVRRSLPTPLTDILSSSCPRPWSALSESLSVRRKQRAARRRRSRRPRPQPGGVTMLQ